MRMVSATYGAAITSSGRPTDSDPKSRASPSRYATSVYRFASELAEGIDRRSVSTRFEELLHRVVVADVGVVFVVEAGAPQLGVIPGEAVRADQMEPVAGVDTEPHQVPRVGCDLRPMDNHVQHVGSVDRRPQSAELALAALKDLTGRAAIDVAAAVEAIVVGAAIE